MKTALILTGGRGSKLWPYGLTRNKAALPIANVPILTRALRLLREAGIGKVVVAADYKADQIQALVVGEDHVHREMLSLPGTAPVVAKLWESLPDDELLVVYGDVLFSGDDVKILLKKFEAENTPAAVLVQSLNGEDPRNGWGAAVRENRVTDILGHPRDDVSHRLTGLFALRKTVLPAIQKTTTAPQAIQIGMMPPDEAELADSLGIFLRSGGEILAVETAGLFVDVDKPWHILEANEAVIREMAQALQTDAIHPTARVHESAILDGHVVLGPNSVIGPRVIVHGNLWLGENSVVTDGAILDGHVVVGDHATVQRYCQVGPLTTIGNRCFVGHGAEFEGVMFDNAYAYHYGEFWGVLGAYSDLGAATVCGNLRFDDAQTVHRVKGRREIPRTGANAAYVGDYCRTGVNAILMPGVKIGPYSLVGAGTLVQGDIPERTLIYAEQTQVKKAWGPERYGW
ncbi:MAG: NTP transferase domain-containing protein [Calditrichaeota bacterium]|nr:NTP transferase domain-containing protein [Calditrichota bacterium]